MKKTYLILTILFTCHSVFAQLSTLQEGFENWPPQDWDIYLLGTATDGWRQDFENISNSGQHSAYSSINNDMCDNWLVTPQIDVVNADYELKFWAYHSSVDFYQRASVHISTNSGDPADGDFTEIYATPEPVTLETWEEAVIDLSAYAGESVYIAFRYEGMFHKWYVDDVSVAPSNFTDGALTAAVFPVGVSETTSNEDVVVTVTNNGTTIINELTIDWTVNGNVQFPYNGTSLNLAPGNSTDLILGSFDFNTEGLYTIETSLNVPSDFDPSNNDLDWNYTVSSFKDGSLLSLTPEGITPLTGIQEVSATIKNEGDNTIDEISVNWTVNGVAQPVFSTSSLNLAPGSTTDVLIGQFDFATSGLYEIEATLSALGDINPDNDTYLAKAAIDTFWESFEGAEFPPEQWSIVFGIREDSNFGNAVEGEYFYSSQPDENMFGQVSDTIYTPRLQIAAGDTFTFFIETSSFLATENEVIWKDGVTGQVNVIQSISPTPNSWQEITVDISAAEGNNYIGVTSTVDGAPGLAKFDLFSSTASLHLYDQDLAIKNGDIYFLARDNVSESFDVLVKNVGAQAVNGSAYTVRLMEAPGVVLATASGINLGSWEETVITVNHTFSGQSTHRLYFEIDFAQDQNLDNNIFREADVFVVPPGVVLDEMGPKGQYNLNFPFDAAGSTQSLGQDDISQSLYLSSDFDNPGQVYGIVYSYDNLLASDRVQQLPLQVWISQTQLSDLSGGYLPNSELVLVFDGVVEILPGNNRELFIPFDQPVSYSGIDNIVIQNYQYDPQWWPSIPRFYDSSAGGGDIRSISNLNVFNLDPLNPPTGFNAFTDFPYTRFVVDPQINTSLVSGIVTDDSNNPLEDATVAIDGTSISAQTDNNGNYQLIALPYGTYDIIASKFGYNDQMETITLDSQTTVQDFVLTEKAIVEINGRVVGSNDPTTPLENVQISMEGYTSANTSTDNQGLFSFTDVYGDAEYQLTFSLYGYKDKTINVNVADVNVELGDVILEQEFISAFDVVVTTDDEITIEWKDPLLSQKVKLQNDSNQISNSYTNEPNENVWLGNIFTIDDITTITEVEIRTDIFELAVDFVTIDVFDVASEELLASSQQFLIQQDSVQTIDIPNIVVFEDIAVAVHWQNNPESTNSLAIDYSNSSVPNTAFIKFPGESIELLTDFFGGGPDSSFHVRVNTLDDGNPDTNNEELGFNVLRGLASEFPDTSNWELLNTTPVTGTSYIDDDTSSTVPAEEYRYAVEVVYAEENSAETFSNVIDGALLNVSQPDPESGVALFPVPASEVIYLSTALPIDEGSNVQIYDLTGKLVDSIVPVYGSNARMSKNISKLANGVYFVELMINNTIIHKKFIVNN